MDTEAAFNAVLALVDQDAYKSQGYITEFPVLTALARIRQPSAALINKMKSYLAAKPADFLYQRKLYLVYSTVVHTHCKNNACDEATLVIFSHFHSFIVHV